MSTNLKRYISVALVAFSIASIAIDSRAYQTEDTPSPLTTILATDVSPDQPATISSIASFEIDLVTDQSLRDSLLETPEGNSYEVVLTEFTDTSNIDIEAISAVDDLIREQISNLIQNPRIIEVVAGYGDNMQLILTVDDGIGALAIELLDNEGKSIFVIAIANQSQDSILVLPLEQYQSSQIQKLDAYLVQQVTNAGFLEAQEGQFVLLGLELRDIAGKQIPYIISVAGVGDLYYTLEAPILMQEAESAQSQSVEQIIENARMFEIRGEEIGFEMVGTRSSESALSGTEYSFIMPVVTSRPYDLAVTVNDEAGNPVTIEARVVNMAIPINGENVEFVVILGGNSIMPMVTRYDARAYLTEDTFVGVPMTTYPTYHMQFDNLLNVGDQVKIQIWGATDISTATNTWYELVNARGENTFINNAHLYADLFDDHNALVDAVTQQNANTYNNNANNPQRLIRVSTIGLNGN